MRNFAIALRFLTRFPIGRLPDTKDIKPKDLASAMPFFPLVGALIGGALGAAYYLAAFLMPDKPLISSAAVIALYLFLTGGNTSSGLIKTAYAVTLKTKKDILEALSSECSAPAGLLAALCVFIMKFALIGSLTKSNALAALVLSAACGRAFIVLASKFYPHAKQDGVTRQFTEFVGLKETIFSIVTIVLLAIIFAGLKGWMILLIAFIALLAAGTYITRRTAGMTVETLGAINEIIETVFLFLFILIP